MDRKRFVIPLVYIPEEFSEGAEIVDSLRVRMKKDHYTYVPALDMRMKDRAEFISEMIRFADVMWQRAEKSEEEVEETEDKSETEVGEEISPE